MGGQAVVGLVGLVHHSPDLSGSRRESRVERGRRGRSDEASREAGGAAHKQLRNSLLMALRVLGNPKP